MSPIENGSTYPLPPCFQVQHLGQRDFILDTPSILSLSEYCQKFGNYFDKDGFRKLSRPWLSALCGEKRGEAIPRILGLLQIVNPRVLPYQKAVSCLAEEAEKLSNRKTANGENPHYLLGKYLQEILLFPNYSPPVKSEAEKLFWEYPSSCLEAQEKAIKKGNNSQAETCWAIAKEAFTQGACDFYWSVQSEVWRIRLAWKTDQRLSLQLT